MNNKPPEVLAAIGKAEHIARAVRKIKRQNGFYGTDPKSVEDIDVNMLRQLVTENGVPIFLGDTGIVEDSRALVFSTPDLVGKLAEATIIGCDGTFDVGFMD
jgi:hypothetical protein